MSDDLPMVFEAPGQTGVGKLRDAMMPRSMGEALEFARAMAQSQFVPRCFAGKPQEIVAAIMFGAEIGLSPMQALRGIQVINGQPAVYGDTLLAICQSHPKWAGKEETFEKGDEPDSLTAICIVRRKGEPDAKAKFSVADAKRAGLWDKAGPWKQYPARMLKMRARSFALRDQFSDALRGIIAAEEAEDFPVGPDNARDVSPRAPTRPSLDDFAREQEARRPAQEPRQAPIDLEAADDAGDPADEASGEAQDDVAAEPATFALVIPGSGRAVALDSYAVAAKMVRDKAQQAPTAAYIRALVNANGWLAEDDALEIEAMADARDGAQRELV